MTDLDYSGAAVAAAEDVIVTVDTTGHITSWNGAAERLFGYTESDAVGQTLALIVPEVHRPRHAAAFHAAIGGGKLAHGGQAALVEGVAADGVTIPLEMTLGLIPGEDDTPVGVVAVLRRGATEPISFI
jgi:PAS domain S-box-containing protein